MVDEQVAATALALASRRLCRPGGESSMLERKRRLACCSCDGCRRGPCREGDACVNKRS